MSDGAKATKRVVSAAAGFVMTTNDWPIKLHSFEQGERWDELCEALRSLQDMVKKL